MFYLDHWRKHLTYLLQFFCKKENRTVFFCNLEKYKSSKANQCDTFHLTYCTVLAPRPEITTTTFHHARKRWSQHCWFLTENGALEMDLACVLIMCGVVWCCTLHISSFSLSCLSAAPEQTRISGRWPPAQRRPSSQSAEPPEQMQPKILGVFFDFLWFSGCWLLPCNLRSDHRLCSLWSQ